MDNTSFSLLELNTQVKNAINDYLPDAYWLRAETIDVRQNQNGHCYLEFIEKDSRNQNIIARARAIIWANTYTLMSTYFEEQTGQKFVSGLNVLVRVSVEFHELYGYSLNVVDIDPSFTIGEIARKRQLILNQLEADGVLTLNKELCFSEITNRIAVISSPTAAGYEDFSDQLFNNSYGFVFYTKLFPAIMQGDRTEQSIIEALDKIYQHMHLFDAVVIIRGGGSSTDLSSFDSYEIASNCAQFPLPIISGIGHERDVTVVDSVAHTRVKTPTAAAEFLVERLTKMDSHLIDLKQKLVFFSKNIIDGEKKIIFDVSKTMVNASNIFIRDELSYLDTQKVELKYNVQHIMQKENHNIATNEQYIRMISPENILKRGYTITVKNGHIIKNKNDVSVDDTVEIFFYDGKVESIISKK